MFMRDENLNSSLDGICASCNNLEKIDFVEQWWGHNLYMVGTCPNCEYEHHVPLEKRRLK